MQQFNFLMSWFCKLCGVSNSQRGSLLEMNSFSKKKKEKKMSFNN